MIDPDELRDMVDMVGHVPDVGRIGRANEHPHAGDAHHPALRRQRLDRFVGLDARMIDERAGIAMRDRDRTLRDFDRVEGRLVAAVRDIDEHVLLFHLGYVIAHQALTPATAAAAAAAEEKAARKAKKVADDVTDDVVVAEGEEALADLEVAEEEPIAAEGDETFLEEEEEEGGDVSGIIGGPVAEGGEEV